jgi:DNA repair protein RecO (recombination protein O)
MEWHDDAIILSVRKHGETAAIVSLLTRDHGRHLGLVRGGQSRRRQGLLQPGNLVAAGWRARLPEHLGTLTLEPKRDLAAGVLDDGGRLKALAAMTALLEATLAEQDPQPTVYGASLAMAEILADGGEGGAGGPVPDWLAAYVRWELGLLRELGFGLDLDTCAATGARDNLVYVSPRSGRAVSAEAGEPWRDRLLPLPGFLLDDALSPAAMADIVAGLRLTGHFFDRHHFAQQSGRLPSARDRLVAALSA